MSEFSEYQKQMAKIYGVPEQYFPADEPTEELDTSGGYKRGTGWDGRLPTLPLTAEQERQRLASIYGVNPAYWPVTEAESGQTD